MTRKMVIVAVFGLAGCASLAGSYETKVRINTTPSLAHCDLKGEGDWKASLKTPAEVIVPSSAAPVTVTCIAPGRKATTYTLDATRDGWRWGNSALIAVTGGAAVLGLLLDESLDAGKSYSPNVTYSLDEKHPHTITVKDRSGAGMQLQSR